MIRKTILLRIVFGMTFIVLLAGCGPYLRQPLQPRRAIIGPETPAKKILLELPKPKEKIVTAVYKFRDQTGQYKPSETGANWSTAVTQGATTILIRALEESGWFIPIERENIGNLLNERKIIRSSRAQYEGKDENTTLLPPLLFAGVIMEGGIISYETNILTGGAGVRYFGADASGQYREDRVSIYIRAVSTANGKVLKTVYTTKSLLSQEISAGIFRYVKAQRLLEAETGFTYNEPQEICVTEAIEKAVETLIIEGVNEKLWSLKEPKDTASTVFTRYENEKRISYQSDVLDKYIEKNNRGIFSLGFTGGASKYVGDYASAPFKPKSSFLIGFALSNRFFIETELGQRYLTVAKKIKDDSYSGNLSLRYVFLPHDRFSPWLSLGGGVDYNFLGVGSSNQMYLPTLNGSFGFEYMLGKKVGLIVAAGMDYYTDDGFDGAQSGWYNDFSWGIKTGLKIYFGKLKQQNKK